MINLKYVWIRNYETIRIIEEHSHQCAELVYYIKGSGNVTVDDEKFSFNAGDVMLILPTLKHKEIQKEMTNMIAVGFTVDSEIVPNKSLLIKDENSVFFNLFQKIRYEFKNKEIYYTENIENYISNILIEMSRYASNSSNKKKSELDPYINYFREYHSHKINIKSIAKEAGYSSDYFSVLFKEQTGYTPKEFIQNERFEHAKRLLKEENLKLDEVSERCGFEYYCEFSSFFKSKSGMSPLKYKKSNNEY